MNCDKCKFSGICKFEDDARSYEEQLHQWINTTTRPDNLEILVKCTKFSLKYPAVNIK